MSDAFKRFAAALALSPTAQTTGRIDGAAASAYVWGWQDGRGEDKDTEVATTFGLLYGEMSALYAAEKLPWKDNIGSAFKRWQETGDVMTPDQREYLRKHL